MIPVLSLYTYRRTALNAVVVGDHSQDQVDVQHNLALAVARQTIHCRI